MLLDHLFVVIFAIIYPVAGFFGFRRLLRKIEAGMPVKRNHLYRNTILWHWILFAIGMIVWALSGRSWDAFGFGLELNSRFLAGAAITVSGITILVMQIHQLAAADQADLDRVKSQFGDLTLLLPRNGNEMIVFNVLSVTAGIVEETLWRGFLIWYLSSFMPIWLAGVISTVGFGLAHGYQGAQNIPRITFVGAIFTVLYLLTGSLWLPVILHAAVDLLQGRLAYDVLRRVAR